MNYKETVEAHIDEYITRNLGGLKRNPCYKHVLSEDNKVSESFLEFNKTNYNNNRNEIGELHSPYNLKSSQLFCLDLFLPYKNKPNQIKEVLNLNSDIEILEFEKVFKDYTHVDLYLLDKDNHKILIEFKYTEEKFDRIEILKLKHHSKWNRMYSKINAYFSIPISKQQFFNNYQLYRNLYNSMTNEHGNQGYFITLYPSLNERLDTQFNDFICELKKHGFTEMLPMKKHIRNLKINHELYKEKYYYV